MRKEIKTQSTEPEYYCDICGEEIEGYSTMGSITYPDQIIEECHICGLETCPSCRIRIPETHLYDQFTREICKVCATEKADLIIALYKHLEDSHAKSRELFTGIFKATDKPKDDEERDGK